MDKKKKITIGIITLLIILLALSAVIYAVAKSNNKNEAGKKEYADKIEEATGGKITVTENKKVEEGKPSKPSGDISSSSSSSAGSSSSVSKPPKQDSGSSGETTESSSKPSRPSKPSGGTSGNASKPAKPSEPSKPSKPAEQSKPTKPSEPSKPTKPAEPSKPTKPAEPSKPTKPSEQPKPQHSHNWKPVYETVTKYRTEWIGKYICESDAGTKYFDTHAEADDYYAWCGENGYGCNYYWDDYAIEETVPYQEEVLKGYKCSCGATR